MKFHVVLTEKDADIIAFKKYLPHGKFNEAVIHILQHAVSGKPIERTMHFDIDLLAPRSDTKIDLPPDLVRQCKKLFKGPFTTGVKEEIKKFIQNNREDTAKQRFSVNGLNKVFGQAETKMEKLKITYDNQPGKYKVILKEYRKFLGRMVDVIADKACPAVISDDSCESEE